MQNSSVLPRRNSSHLIRSITISQKSGLARKLLIAVLLISSLFTVFQASYQLYVDYKAGINTVNNNFEQIYSSYNKSLVRSIWEVDAEETRIIGVGILSLPTVEFVDIREKSEDTFQTVVMVKTDNIESLTSKTYTLELEENGESIIVGELKLQISLAPLYEELFDKLIFILIFQAIKTFSVSILIFATFHILVTQHLIAMSAFSAGISEDNLDEPLVLHRIKPSSNDELDVMAQALNNTKNTMRTMLESKASSQNLQDKLAQNQHRESLDLEHRLQIEDKNTELNQMITTLNETQAQLVSSEKSALLGSMVNGVAHELNTPIGISITGISHLQSEARRIQKLFSQSAMTKSDLSNFFEEIKSLTHSIDISLQKAAELIQSFKLVAVEQHQDTSCSFNLYQNFEDITKSLQHTFKARNIEICNEIPPDINIVSYPGVFYQIYTNLLNNANLHAFEHTNSGKILLEAEMTNDLLTLKFSDDGQGMPKETLEQLLVPFFTTKRGSGGSGLGMSIVDTLVTKKLKGKMSVASEEGKGTQFTIVLNSIV